MVEGTPLRVFLDSQAQPPVIALGQALKSRETINRVHHSIHNILYSQNSIDKYVNHEFSA
jgi:hypothetical protein